MPEASTRRGRKKKTTHVVIEEQPQELPPVSSHVPDEAVPVAHSAIEEPGVDDEWSDDMPDEDDEAPVVTNLPRKRKKEVGKALGGSWKNRNPMFAQFVKMVKQYRREHPDVPYQEVLQIVKRMRE